MSKTVEHRALMWKMLDCRVPTLEDKIVSKTFKYFTSEHTAEGISPNKLTYMAPFPLFQCWKPKCWAERLNAETWNVFKFQHWKRGRGCKGKIALICRVEHAIVFDKKKRWRKKVLPTYFVLECLNSWNASNLFRYLVMILPCAFSCRNGKIYLPKAVQCFFSHERLKQMHFWSMHLWLWLRAEWVLLRWKLLLLQNWISKN